MEVVNTDYLKEYNIVGGNVLGDISSTLHVLKDQRELLTKHLVRTWNINRPRTLNLYLIYAQFRGAYQIV